MPVGTACQLPPSTVRPLTPRLLGGAGATLHSTPLRPSSAAPSPGSVAPPPPPLWDAHAAAYTCTPAADSGTAYTARNCDATPGLQSSN